MLNGLPEAFPMLRLRMERFLLNTALAALEGVASSLHQSLATGESNVERSRSSDALVGTE